MTELELSNWIYRYTVRTEGMFNSPKGFDLANWVLPKNVALHYFPIAFSDKGPTNDWFAIRNIKRQYYLQHIDAITGNEGAPRSLGAVNIGIMGKAFNRGNTRIKRASKLPMALLDKKYPMVFNYGLLTPKYRYQRHAMSRLYRFNNMWRTLVDTVESVASQSTRQHLIFVDIPSVLPPRAKFHSVEEFEQEYLSLAIPATLREFQEGKLSQEPELNFNDVWRFTPDIPGYVPMNGIDDGGLESFDASDLGWSDDTATVELEGCDCDISFEAWSRVTLGWFPDDASLRVADIWKWLSEERADSILSGISAANYDKVWLVFTSGGRYNAISLARLDEMRSQNVTATCNRFYKYISTLQSFQLADAKDVVLSTVPNTPADKSMTLGIIPSDDSDATAIEEEDKLALSVSERAKERIEFNAGKSKVTLQTPVVDINDLDNADITEVNPEDLDELPPERAEQVLIKPTLVDTTLIDTNNPLEANIAAKSAKLLQQGIISPAEHKRHLRLARKYKEIRIGDVTLEQLARVPEEVVWGFKPATIPDIPYVTDKGMLKSSLINFDHDYTSKVMEHDTANMVLHLQRAGIAITDFKKEEYTDALSRTIDYRIKVNNLGKESTLSFQIPRIDRNGKYVVNGVKYYMRKMPMDKPIRKINPTEVVLTTYYGKLFIERSRKSRNSWDNWITNTIAADIIGESSLIKNAVYGNSYGENQVVPRMYSAIAQTYLEFELNGIKFYWDYPSIATNFPQVKPVNNRIPVGYKGKLVVYMDWNSRLYIDNKDIGTIPEYLGVSLNDGPNEVVVLRCMGQEIPIGIVLAYLLGLNKLANILYGNVALEAHDTPVYPRRRMKGSKRDTAANEFEVVWGDEIWVMPADGSKAALIMASFNLWKKYINKFTCAELNDRSFYTVLGMEAGLSNRHFIELELIDELFLDPIAIENLTAMQEPTAIRPLMVRAVDLLVDDTYKSDLDTSMTLIKGYERMNGAVYRAMIEAIRNQRNKRVAGKASIDLNPFEVMISIQKDPSVSLVEDSNIIHNLKEKENVTYSGVGGRNKRGMVQRTRVFHPSAIGIRSEAGVDSGDVGINTFLTADPNITSLRGTVETVDISKAPVTQIVSTTMLTNPFMDYDDGKRAFLSGIQQSHIVAIAEPDNMFVRTGYDQVLAHRADDLFSFSAKQDGKVVSIQDKVITIQYKDGSKDTCQIGRRFGIVAGGVVPHSIVTDLKPGDKFKEGRIICYNSGFLRTDVRDKTQVSLLSGTYPYTALLEKNETWEDSSLISPGLAHKMRSRVSHVRTLLVRFTDAIHNLVEEGDELDIDTTLCIIEDKSIAVVGENLEALNMLARPSPRSQHSGIVEDIEVIYFGDKDDMSDSLRKVADKYDRKRAKLAKALGNGDAQTGEIVVPCRIDKYQIDIDMMAIRIYITEERVMSGGDKLVLSNQLKSVTAGEQKGPTVTATELWPGGGVRPVDLEFSYRAQEARIVHSSIMAGLSVISQEYISYATAKAYGL